MAFTTTLILLLANRILVDGHLAGIFYCDSDSDLFIIHQVFHTEAETMQNDGLVRVFDIFD